MAYYGFINENLQKEVDGNRKGHIIFNYQRESDMVRLKELLKAEDKITVEFSEDWYPAQNILYDIKDRKTHLAGARQYVTAKILEVLEEKYPQLKEYEGSKNLEIFKQGDLELYSKKSNSLYGLKDLEEMLSIEDIHIDRIHLIIRSIGSPLLFNAIAMLLSDETPFSISAYASESSFPLYDPDSIENKWLTETYSYTIFNKGKAAELSYRYRESQKQKKKKKNQKGNNEEV